MSQPTSAGSTWGVVVAAGRGTRFGGPKQLEPLGSRRVVEHSLAAAARHCDGVVLVVAPGEDVSSMALRPQPHVTVPGGATRSASVRAGLDAVPPDAAIVVVHDAARPLASDELFAGVVAAVRSGADAAVPGVEVADTLKRVDGARVTGTVDRSALVAVQTPQAFRAEALRAAHAGATDATDDAALVEAAGGTVVVVPGDPVNRKITEPRDLHMARRLLGVEIRTGHGFDSHDRAPEGAGGVLVLAGVTWPEERPLAGHSDGDAVAHAITDAILGGAGLGDIGSWFPDTDAALAGADSVGLLAEAAAAAAAEGWSVVHVDVSVVAASPRLAPRRDEIVDRLSAAAGGPVSVKGKRPEGFAGPLADGAVAAWAVATLARGRP